MHREKVGELRCDGQRIRMACIPLDSDADGPGALSAPPPERPRPAKRSLLGVRGRGGGAENGLGGIAVGWAPVRRPGPVRRGKPRVPGAVPGIGFSKTGGGLRLWA